MLTMIINDVVMEAKVGERVLNVARRNAAHIGFICDNAGTCQTCRCQVLTGAEHLSPPNEIEQAWIPNAKLAKGHRLACQTIIRGEGEVRIESYAEYIRRLVLAVLSPPPGTNAVDNIQPLVRNMFSDFADQLSNFPGNILSVLNRIGPVRFAFPILNTERFLNDTGRVFRRMRSDGELFDRAPDAPASEQPPPVQRK
jgi:ferredoxin